MLETQNYDFTIRNNTPRPVTLWAGLAIYDDEQNLVFKSDPKVAGPIGRIEMRVPAQDIAYGRLTAPSIKFWFPQTVAVEVEIFRNQFDMQIFLRSDALPILMSYTG